MTRDDEYERYIDGPTKPGINKDLCDNVNQNSNRRIKNSNSNNRTHQQKKKVLQN